MKQTEYKYALLIDGKVRYSILSTKLSIAPADFLFLGEIEVDYGDDTENRAKLLNQQEWLEVVESES